MQNQEQKHNPSVCLAKRNQEAIVPRMLGEKKYVSTGPSPLQSLLGKQRLPGNAAAEQAQKADDLVRLSDS